MMPPATWNANPSTQNSNSRTISVQSMMSLPPEKKGQAACLLLLPTSPLRRAVDLDRHRRPAGRFPGTRDDRGHGGDRLVEPVLHRRALGGEERGVIRLVVDVAVADRVRTPFQQRRHALRAL